MSERFHDPMPVEDMPWIDRHSIEDVVDFKDHLQGVAASVAELLMTPGVTSAQSFMTGAQQALKRFGVTTRVNKVTSATTFRFAELKDKRMTAFIIGDASRKNAQKEPMALLQFCMFQELKRHKSLHTPVYFLCDEATNFYIHDLQSFLTWARGYGVRIHLIIQFFSEFRQVYGPEAFKTLLDAVEILQILPGNSERDALELIKHMLGDESVVSESQGSAGLFSGVSDTRYSEEAKPTLSTDQIRRLKKVILFIRKHKPALVETPPIAAISPFRKQVAIDPFHGKPFLKRVRLRLEGRDGPLLWRVLAPHLKRIGRVFRSGDKERRS